ncbi:MAG TPA: alpha/beta hydrolase [Acidimicrobiales bacterium]|nr:alpha/beta hydrolase [Acidimicrobiales bacterium]
MAMLEHGSVRLHYQIEGEGFPVLLIAPGGMRSANDLWNRMPWNPRTALRDHYRVIGMDQRNAGASSGPVSATDDWTTYAQDQLALLDHLAIDRCHVVGMCIGGPYIMGLLRVAPERFSSAVLLQPVGVDGNTAALLEMFHAWATDIAPHHPEATAADWSAFADNMYGGEFILSATRAEVAACQTPMLVLMGDDQYHPQSTSRELAALAPHATLVEHWKDDALLADTDATIKRFLAEHTPR